MRVGGDGQAPLELLKLLFVITILTPKTCCNMPFRLQYSLLYSPLTCPLTLAQVDFTCIASTLRMGMAQNYMVVWRRELTLAGVWDSSVLTEFEEEQWDPVFVSDPDTRRFLDSGELDIYRSSTQI